jgi:quercetin dioxygenase-like cupin family protein
MKNEVAITEIVPTFPIHATLEKIEAVEVKLLDLPQVTMPLIHLFSPGVYYREIFMPKGTFVIGHQHKTEHLNIVLAGKATVLMDGQLQEITAPSTFVSKAGVRKMLYIIEDMRWVTIHPTAGLEDCGQDIEKLEDALRVKSGAFLKHEEAAKLLNR